MTNARRDGLYLLALGAAIFVLLGVLLQHSASDSREDFKAVDYGARCLLHHCDPYREADLFRYYQHEFGEPTASHLRAHTLTLYVNLPATILFVAPFALLPFGVASALWSLLTAASLILAAYLAWDLASTYAPALAGALIALSLSSGAIVLGNLNPAGIVVAFCVIAVWCFLKQRFIVVGILCLAVSLALKPHDAGLVWLYLLLASGNLPGSLRKRALQTLAATTLLTLAAILWVSLSAPHWPSELRSNMAVMSSPGGNNDPALTGPTSRDRATETIVSLQSATSVFSDQPGVYNGITYLVCGVLLLLWLVATLRSGPSPALTWLALAAVVPLTMLVTYHRAYDTRLLLLAVPACSMHCAKRRLAGKFAVPITMLAIVCTGELPYALFKLATPNLIPASETTPSFSEKLSTLFLGRAGSLALLLMALFYLAIYLHRALVSRDRLTPPITPAGACDTMVTTRN